MSPRMSRLPAVVVLCGLGALGLVAGLSCGAEPEPKQYACTQDDALELYERRIAPLLVPGAATSCNDCHLAGVDLGLFAQDTPCGTMACMKERGLVDFTAPERSLVLEWILRADPASPLITEAIIESEHDAMLEWIEYSARCGDLVCDAPAAGACGAQPSSDDCTIPSSGPGGGRKAWEDPGDCSDRTIELMFQQTVYSWRGRCAPCHFTDNPSVTSEAPRWIATGDCAVASLETMRNVIRNGYVDLSLPVQSLLVLKPLAESAGGVEHGGGDKFHDASDPAYADFIAWIQRYKSCGAEEP